MGPALEGEPLPVEGVHHRPRLAGGAVEHRDVGEGQPGLPRPVHPGVERMEGRAAQGLLDEAHDNRCLVSLVGGAAQQYRSAVRMLPDRAQGPAGHQSGRFDQADGRLDDHGGGAVVAGQRHHLRVPEVVPETQEEAHVGTAEGVDGLVRVADRTQVRRRHGFRWTGGRGVAEAPGQHGQQDVLQLVDVLVLVDPDVLPARPVLVGDLGMLPHRQHGQLDEVVEVDQVARAQLTLVPPRHHGQLVPVGGLPERAGAAQPGQRAPQSLQVARPRRRTGQRLPQDLRAHRLVRDRDIRPQAEARVLLLDHPQPQAVEGGRENARRLLRDERVEPFAQFGRGPPGEGHRQAPLGRHRALPHPVRDRVDEGAGLAGPRPGDDQQRAVRDRCRGALLGVESGQDGHAGHLGRHALRRHIHHVGGGPVKGTRVGGGPVGRWRPGGWSAGERVSGGDTLPGSRLRRIHRTRQACGAVHRGRGRG